MYLQFQTYKEPFHSLLEQYRSFLHNSSIGENLWHHNVLPDCKTLTVKLNVISVSVISVLNRHRKKLFMFINIQIPVQFTGLTNMG